MAGEPTDQLQLINNTTVAMNVCVLGASGGIGGSIADALAEAGHQVVRCYRRRAGNYPSPATNDGHVIAFVETSSLTEASATLDTLLGSMPTDCIINAIGLGRSTHSPPNHVPIPTVDLSLQEWEEIIYLNLKLPILITKLAQKHQLRSVIHIGSALTAHGLHGTAMAQAYSASKRGLFDYCEFVNQSEHEQLTVACLAPGLVQTRMTESSGLRMLFEGELKPETVAEWIMAVLDHDSISLSVLLPLRATSK
jgi:NAD(P)-dependent dehydrogenase (short-subunit alcohol dehydrogenase family)